MVLSNGTRDNVVTGGASALGHEFFSTTAESDAKREAQQKRALAVLIGGRLAS